MRSYVLVAALAMLASAQAIKFSVTVSDDSADSMVNPGACKYTGEGECLADDCCNWCSSPFNASVGFCMNSLPYMLPGLECKKQPVTCQKLTTAKSCAGHDDCKWMPLGGAGGKADHGLCVHNWDSCKTPAETEQTQNIIYAQLPKKTVKKIAPPTPKPAPTPAPLCAAVTPGECNASPCCNWCASPFNLTGGWCMPTMNKPMPFMSCSKPVTDCKSATTAGACGEAGNCKWMPFGPPGLAPATGSGMCIMDWDSCKA